MSTRPNATSVAIFSQKQVLLIKRALPPYAGYWTLPGGRLETDETIEACAQREIFEELGIKIGDIVPVGQISSGGSHLLQVFAASAPRFQPTPNTEIADWKWVIFAEIETMSTTPGLFDILKSAQACLNKT